MLKIYEIVKKNELNKSLNKKTKHSSEEKSYKKKKKRKPTANNTKILKYVF